MLYPRAGAPDNKGIPHHQHSGQICRHCPADAWGSYIHNPAVLQVFILLGAAVVAVFLSMAYKDKLKGFSEYGMLPQKEGREDKKR